MWRNLAVVRTINPVEADTFRESVVQDFDGVTVEHTNYLSGEVGDEGRTLLVLTCPQLLGHRVSSLTP